MDIYIGFGSNLNRPQEQIMCAYNELNAIHSVECVKLSSLYVSKPLYGLEQPDYINAVAHIRSQLAAIQLLDILQSIEKKLGRPKSRVKNASRIIDIDIILFGKEIICNTRINIPHPGLKCRNFWIYPLWEIAPTLKLPNGKLISTLKNNTTSEGLTLLGGEVQHATDYTYHTE